jgi:hypothetical protein
MLYKSTTNIINIKVRKNEIFVVRNFESGMFSVQSAIQDLAIKNERDMCTLVNKDF